ncbi:MAG TPA: HAMP domain-containing protein [Candidatus Pacearchaeota archaeon]|nr:HAMP domain-containing protein [Candidatus Pacearchaeota archaeon]HOK93956.1 HAMP domain-containing protein [Candidatus Pacearchaeota archaeon]HPO75027.1 HAMP domain-containing protein [Candidatus Pacearchaeota archaeon]
MVETIIGSTECLINGIATLLVSFLSFYTFYYIYKNQSNESYLLYFCLFWLMVAITWLFNGIRLFFAYFGNFEIDKMLFQVGEVFSILFQPLLGSFVIVDRIVKNKNLKIFVFTLFALYFTWVTIAIMLLPVLLSPTSSSYRTNYKHGESETSWQLTEYGLFALAVVWIFDLLQSVFRKKRGRIQPDLVSILVMFSIFLYAVINFFNERILITDWIVIILRILMLTGPFLAIIAAYYLKRENAIKQLTKALEKVRKGNFDVQVNIQTRDEIEEMAETFNKMIKDIKAYQSRLEEVAQVLEIRVKARTHQLEEEKANLDLMVKERTKELEKRINELERFHKVTVGRELKMRELKEKNKELEKKIKELEEKLKEK